MNWKAVIKSLREQGDDGSDKAMAIRDKQPLAVSPIAGGDDYQRQLVEDRWKTIERHRIQANFCYGLAEALEAGLKP